MRSIQYTVSAELNDETVQAIYEGDVKIGTIGRVYSRRIKKLFDQFFDYRYFLEYQAAVENKQFTVKKIFRKGRLWFEGHYANNASKTIITYENWRIGVPELVILHENKKIKVEKELEEASCFYENEEVIATWQAQFDEAQQQFHLTLQISEQASVQDPAFYVAISQATLFIGA